MTDKRVKIRGKWWTVKVSEFPDDGYCDESNRTIWINQNLEKDDLQETLDHECLHACYPDLGEEAIDEGAKSRRRLRD